MTSPTKRTLAYLRLRGYAEITGHWNPFAKIRKDLLSFGDILFLPNNAEGIFLVQTTSGANHAARKKKIEECGEAKLWKKCGGRILLISWEKKGARGKRKLWAMREEEL